MPNFRKKNLLQFYVLNSFYMFWAQVVSRLQEFYVSTVRFSVFDFRDTLKEYMWQNFLIEHITDKDA